MTCDANLTWYQYGNSNKALVWSVGPYIPLNSFMKCHFNLRM